MHAEMYAFRALSNLCVCRLNAKHLFFIESVSKARALCIGAEISCAKSFRIPLIA